MTKPAQQEDGSSENDRLYIKMPEAHDLWHFLWNFLPFFNPHHAGSCSIDPCVTGDAAGQRTVTDVIVRKRVLHGLPPVLGVRRIFKGTGCRNDELCVRNI